MVRSLLFALCLGCADTRGAWTAAVGGGVAATGIGIGVAMDAREHEGACCSDGSLVAMGGFALGSALVLTGLVNVAVLKLSE